MMATTFGPSAVVTPANAMTIARLILTVPLLWMILEHGASWAALALWVLLASTDGADGYLARRHGTTRSGAFLDPLADKALVLGALGALAVAGTFAWAPVLLITARELGIVALRSYWVRRGMALPATGMAKAKTFVQVLAVGLALAPWVAQDNSWIAEAALWAAVALTLLTGAQYVRAGSRGATSAGSR